MRKSLPAFVCLLLSAAAAPAAGAELDCPFSLTPDFPVKELYRCPALYRNLCIDVCGSRYEDSDVRQAMRLPKGERAVVCLDPSISVIKNGSPYSDDRERHGCFSGIEGRSAGGGGRTWCVQLNNVYDGRSLCAYLQCAGRLDPDYVPPASANGGRPTVMLLQDGPKTLRVGSERADDPDGAYSATGTSPVMDPVVMPGGATAAAGWPPKRTDTAPMAGYNIEDFGTNPFEKRIAESKMQDALAARGQLAAAVRRYRGEHGGQLPPDLTALVPGYLKELPEIEIPGYKKTRGIVVVREADGGELAGFVRDTGGWLYVADSASKKRGAVSFDSVKRYRGKPLYSY